MTQNDISDIRLIDFGESIHIEPQSYYNEFGMTFIYTLFKIVDKYGFV